MKKKSQPYKIFLSILIPIYSFLFILIIYLYLKEENKTSFLNENNFLNKLKNSTSTIQIPLDEIKKMQEENLNIDNISSSTILQTTSNIASNTNLKSNNNIKENNSIATSSYISEKFGEYIEIKDSCDVNYNGGCVVARNGPGSNFRSVLKLRDGMVLKTSGKGMGQDGKIWYHIIFDEWLRYPERIEGDLFVSADFVKERLSKTEKIKNRKLFNQNNKNTKTILIKLNEQKLYAYENINGENKLFLETFISSGLENLPTPIGTFEIFYKTPSRYMQGPIKGLTNDYYDLPGVPWTMYFTADGAAIHGTYWHNNFGDQWSHGCINLYPYDAKTIYDWANLGTKVIIER